MLLFFVVAAVLTSLFPAAFKETRFESRLYIYSCGGEKIDKCEKH